MGTVLFHVNRQTDTTKLIVAFSLFSNAPKKTLSGLPVNCFTFELGAGSVLPSFDVDSGVPRNFFRGAGGQQIQLRTEDREDGDLGAVAP